MTPLLRRLGILLFFLPGILGFSLYIRFIIRSRRGLGLECPKCGRTLIACPRSIENSGRCGHCNAIVDGESREA